MQKSNKDAQHKTSQAKTQPSKLEQLKEDTVPTSTLGKSPTTKHEIQEARSPKIPRNVNFYRHLINDKYASEHDIEWVLKLRSPKESGSKYKMEPTTTQAFSFDGRELEGQKLGRTYSDLNGKNQLHQVRHLFFNRIGPTPTQGGVYFETGLRSYESSSDKLKALENNWRGVPRKDKNEYPTMYPSYQETLKIKTWSTKNLTINTHTGFEGYLNYPKYDELYDRQLKNVSDVKHLLKAPGQLMSSADWQLSMRQYGSKQKKTEANENTTTGSHRALGELKKVNRKPGRL